MSREIMEYTTEQGHVVKIEADTPEGWTDASAQSGKLTARLRDAIQPSLEAAAEVLAEARELGPDEVEVKFGIKVGGQADWLIAKAATEATFEISLSWKSSEAKA